MGGKSVATYYFHHVCRCETLRNSRVLKTRNQVLCSHTYLQLACCVNVHATANKSSYFSLRTKKRLCINCTVVFVCYTYWQRLESCYNVGQTSTIVETGKCHQVLVILKGRFLMALVMPWNFLLSGFNSKVFSTENATSGQ